MNKPDKAGEPSMDEILSSIRKIIAEEPIGSRPQNGADVGAAMDGSGAADKSLGDLGALSVDRGSFDAPGSANGLSNGNAKPEPSSWRGGSTPGNRGYEPELPMPEQAKATRSPLSSRLANALRGNAPSPAPLAPAASAALDDDDLSAVLGDAPLAEPMASEPAPQPLSEPELIAASDPIPTPVLPEPAAKSEPVLLAAEPEQTETPTPMATAAPEPRDVRPERTLSTVPASQTWTPPEVVSDSEAASTFEDRAAVVAKTTEAVEPSDDAAPSVENADVQNGKSVRAPFFSAGPQPPSHLRPTPFSTSDASALEPTAGTLMDNGDEVEVASEADVADDVISTDGPVVIAAMDSAASGDKPLVGLAQAVAATTDGAPEIAPVEIADTDDKELATDNEAAPAPISEELPPVSEIAKGAETLSTREDVSTEVANAADQAEAPSSAAAVVAPNGAAMAAMTASLSPEGVQTLEDTVAELLRPLLREWLADNMPRIVEKALRIEMASSLSQNANGISSSTEIEH